MCVCVCVCVCWGVVARCGIRWGGAWCGCWVLLRVVGRWGGCEMLVGVLRIVACAVVFGVVWCVGVLCGVPVRGAGVTRGGGW